MIESRKPRSILTASSDSIFVMAKVQTDTLPTMCGLVSWMLFCGIIVTVACSEHDVKNAILNGYDNQIRPVKEMSTVTNVTVTTGIYSILSVNEQDESIELLIWLTMIWTDEFLRWNASEFDGCVTIRILASNVWLPDFVFMNMLDNVPLLPSEKQYVTVSNNGRVEFWASSHSTLRCVMDISKFPFDTQFCPLLGTSWTFDNRFVTLFVEDGLLNATDLQKGNSEFETISFTGEAVKVYYEDVYSELHYMLVLKRRPEYYIFVLFIPSFLLTTLCIIGIFTPSSSDGIRDEKMTLGLTTLLSMTVLLNITADEVPKSGKGLPLLGYYVLYEIAVCSLSIIMSTILISVNERASTQHWVPPRIVCWIANRKTLCECVKRLSDVKQAKISDNLITAGHKNQENLMQNGGNQSKVYESCLNSSLNIRSQGNEIIDRLQQIISTFDNHIKEMKNNEEMNVVWIKALDRIDFLLLFIFFTANCILTLSILH